MCMPKYFASAEHGISCSKSFSLFLGTCLPFVDITAVLLFVLFFSPHFYSHDSTSDMYRCRMWMLQCRLQIVIFLFLASQVHLLHIVCVIQQCGQVGALGTPACIGFHSESVPSIVSLNLRSERHDAKRRDLVSGIPAVYILDTSPVV
jgi:hypothetical protein